MFRKLEGGVYASPQITPADLAEAQGLGVTMVINNRPEDESPDQTPGPDIAAAAAALGMGYRAIPVTHAGFAPWQVEAMAEALAAANGAPVLAYCRSGTRSTLLWALAQAAAGRSPAGLAAVAGEAGYDLGPIMPHLDMLAAQAG